MEKVIMSKKMLNLKQQLAKQYHIIGDDGCNHLINKEVVGGWLFLLDEKMYFASHIFNKNVHECYIEYADIDSIDKGKKINSINVHLKDGKEEIFIVNNRKEWIKCMSGLINQ